MGGSPVGQTGAAEATGTPKRSSVKWGASVPEARGGVWAEGGRTSSEACSNLSVNLEHGTGVSALLSGGVFRRKQQAPSTLHAHSTLSDGAFINTHPPLRAYTRGDLTSLG